MTTRGQTRTWWEATLTFSWRDAQCRSVCKSSQPSLLNLLLYNCHHCMRVHVHMCMYVNACAHLYMKTWRPKMDSECLPQSFSFDSLGRVSCWTHPSLANSSRACLASQLCSRTLYPWAPKLGWLVAISSTYFFFFNMDAGDPNSHPHTCMTSTLSQWTISGAHILEPKLSFQKHPYRGILYKRLKCQDWYSEILTNDCSE